jgi:hypothetical protein
MRTIQSCIFTADKNIQKVFKKQFKFFLITIILKKCIASFWRNPHCIEWSSEQHTSFYST